MDKDKKIFWITAIVITGFIIAVVYHYIMGEIIGQGYPYNTFLFDPGARFGDYYNFLMQCRHYNPYFDPTVNYRMLPANYLPLMYFFGYLMFLLDSIIPYFLFVLIVLFSLSAIYWLYGGLAKRYLNRQQLSDLGKEGKAIWSELVKHGDIEEDGQLTDKTYDLDAIELPAQYETKRSLITELIVKARKKAGYFDWLAILVLTFLTYGYLFAVDRANLEIFLFVLMFGFFYFYQKGRIAIAAIFLAAAIDCKIYPAVFMVLLIADKKYKEILLTIILVLVLFIVPFMSFPGSMGEKFGVMPGHFNTFLEIYMYGHGGMPFGHSFLNIIKGVLMDAGRLDLADGIYATYSSAMLFFFVIVAFYVVFLEKEKWKRVMALMIAMLLFPQVSSDYKLVHLLFPLTYFINSGSKDDLDPVYLGLFGMLLIPKAYSHANYMSNFNTGAILAPIGLTVFLILLITRTARGFDADKIIKLFFEHISEMKKALK